MTLVFGNTIGNETKTGSDRNNLDTPQSYRHVCIKKVLDGDSECGDNGETPPRTVEENGPFDTMGGLIKQTEGNRKMSELKGRRSHYKKVLFPYRKGDEFWRV